MPEKKKKVLKKKTNEKTKGGFLGFFENPKPIEQKPLNQPLNQQPLNQQPLNQPLNQKALNQNLKQYNGQIIKPQIVKSQIDERNIAEFIKKTDIERIKTNSKIAGGDGSQYLEFNLQSNDSIYAAAESLIYNDNGVEQAELKMDGIFQSMKKMLAGENLFYQQFTAIPNKSGIVVLGTSFINSIICIKVLKDNPLRFSRGSFLASTPNIKLNMTIQIKGILGIGQEEGFILPIAECIFGEYGYIWLSAYGSFKEIDMTKEGYEITIDNGMFLACENSKEYELVFMGKGLFSSFFGGEGFGMKFKSGKPLYIQTKNSNELLTTQESAGGEEDGILGQAMDLNILDGFSME